MPNNGAPVRRLTARRDSGGNGEEIALYSYFRCVSVYLLAGTLRSVLGTVRVL